MRTFSIAVAALALVLSACAPEAPVEAEEPQREFFVETEEREPDREPREPEPPATATATGSTVYQPPAPPPEAVEDTAPEVEDPFYRPPGLDPCEENAHGFVDNDACLAQNGYPIE